MSKKPKPKQRSVRFKPRRFVLFGLLLAAAVGGFFGLKAVRDRFGAKHYLEGGQAPGRQEKVLARRRLPEPPTSTSSPTTSTRWS